MRVALADLKLDSLDVIHAGDGTFPLAERVRAVPLDRILTDLEPLGWRTGGPASALAAGAFFLSPPISV